MEGTTVGLHWANEPYKWHINDGQEVLAVMDGEVDMHYKENDEINIVRLKVGDIFYADAGTEHVAHPVGEARVLVIEKEGSVLCKRKLNTLLINSKEEAILDDEYYLYFFT